MKKISLFIATTLLLSACENGSTGAIGRELAKSYINNQCHTELDNRQEWQFVTLLMSKETKTTWENKICSCASEEASAQLSSSELAEMITNEGRLRVLGRVTGKTVTMCVKRLYGDVVSQFSGN